MPKKTVFIVGASFAGFTLAEQLWNDFNVTLIDKKDHFEYLPTNIKCSVDATWADHLMVSLQDSKKAFNNKFQVI